jgi:hypothetical protein
MRWLVVILILQTDGSAISNFSVMFTKIPYINQLRETSILCFIDFGVSTGL